MKIKGFIFIESMMALVISFFSVTILALIVVQGQKIEKIMEERTDAKLAERIMKNNDLNSIRIHDHVYYLNEE
ncbi:type IV pilus modification PilV family protein [Lactobacillus agrestimuris]|uniref:type IV pilus modification PilV family protein n=1 Tax=Lactobacillus agrestimuris TaxID=2941328 RepID=UPI0020444B9A|nr:hypothetical protein [Lactobacillus agrestimuris]